MIFDNIKQADKNEFVKWTIGLTFAAVLTTANLTAAKLAVYDLPLLGSTVGSVAAVAIGINFFCTDLICETYGKATARRIINGTIFALLIAYLLVFLSIQLPTADSYANGSEFATVFSSSFPIIMASIISILVTQNLDVSIFHRLKNLTRGRHKWLRNIGSTSISQFLDTALFTLMAFVVFPPIFGTAAVPLGVAWSIIIAEYFIKVAVAVLDTPFFYLFSGLMERYDVGIGNYANAQADVS